MIQNKHKGNFVISNDTYAYITDIYDNKGTYQYNLLDKSSKLLNFYAICMTEVDDLLLYIDQNKDNKLFSYNASDGEIGLYINHSMRSFLVVEDGIFFISLKDEKVYKYDYRKRKERCIIHEKVKKMNIYDEVLTYVVKDKICFYNVLSNTESEALQCQAIEVYFNENELYYMEDISFDNYYFNNIKKEKFDYNIGSLVGDESYLFISECDHEQNLFRLNKNDKSEIRINNESSDYLYINNSKLFYATEFSWKIMNTQSFDISNIELGGQDV